MEREEFLNRVRAARRGAVLPEIDGPTVAPSISFEDPVDSFVSKAGLVAAEVVRVASTAGAVEVVADALDPVGDYVAWDDLDSFAPGWDRLVGTRPWRKVDATVGTGTRPVDHERIGAVKVGITGADAAIAATGTVVLGHGPGRPRSASLLVERHIVLLPAERVVSSLADSLDRVDWSTSHVVAVTGPSRTGDIESILTLGVHGPRDLQIVLIG